MVNKAEIFRLAREHLNAGRAVDHAALALDGDREHRRLRKLDRDGDGWVRPNEMRTPPARDRMRDAPPPSQAPAADEY